MTIHTFTISVSNVFPVLLPLAIEAIEKRKNDAGMASAICTIYYMCRLNKAVYWKLF